VSSGNGSPHHLEGVDEPPPKQISAACSVRNISLDVDTLDAIKPKGFQHGLVVKPVQIDRLPFTSSSSSYTCKMLILTPGRDAERVILSPLYLLTVDQRVPASLDDMVD